MWKTFWGVLFALIFFFIVLPVLFTLFTVVGLIWWAGRMS